MTKVPVILVHDWADDPPMTTTYICGENVLDVETVYRAFKDLKLHKGRGTLGLAPLENGMGSSMYPFLLPRQILSVHRTGPQGVLHRLHRTVLHLLPLPARLFRRFRPLR